MNHPVLGTSLGAVAHLQATLAAPPLSGGAVPLDEARGVVRDVLAAVRNVEHLLRSPRVGSRPILQVIPGLQGLCEPLAASVDSILAHVRELAGDTVEHAVTSLRADVQALCERFRAVLDRASQGHSLDAKRRLAFESAIARIGGELNTVRQLLDLLIQSTYHCNTELDVEELVQVAFSTPPSGATARETKVTVVARYVSDGSGFQASPHVFMPLLAIAIATVRGDERDPVYLEAVCRDGAPVVISVSRDASPEGDELRFEPPTMTPASVICAETAARLAGGVFVAERGRVVLSWSRAAS